MAYRTKTYIAGDWDGDKNLIETLYDWNNSCCWGLHFHDAHEITQARDTSLPCSIKKSLAERLDASKTFVLIVGNHTKALTKGSCVHCGSYNTWSHYCARGSSVSFKSFVEYECDKAVRDGLRVVVLYNSTHVDRDKCPDSVRRVGEHVPAIVRRPSGFVWNYPAIARAITG